jgi:hypothetical protein
MRSACGFQGRLGRRLAALALAAGLVAACGKASAPETSKVPGPRVPAPPTDVSITGAIPDLRVAVRPGEAESGRISVTWVASGENIDGFRIYVEGCAPKLELALELGAGERTYGPLNPCRPSRVGVAAFNAAGQSEIAWGVASLRDR